MYTYHPQMPPNKIYKRVKIRVSTRLFRYIPIETPRCFHAGEFLALAGSRKHHLGSSRRHLSHLPAHGQPMPDTCYLGLVDTSR